MAVLQSKHFSNFVYKWIFYWEVFLWGDFYLMTLENKHDSQSSFIYRKEKEPEFQKRIKNDVKTGGKRAQQL